MAFASEAPDEREVLAARQQATFRAQESMGDTLTGYHRQLPPLQRMLELPLEPAYATVDVYFKSIHEEGIFPAPSFLGPFLAHAYWVPTIWLKSEILAIEEDVLRRVVEWAWRGWLERENLLP